MSTAPANEATAAPGGPTNLPFLRRVRIRGYKSIAFCDVTLEPLTVLVGRNASGKSNFLDALAFMRDVLVKGAVEGAILHRGRKAILLCGSTDNLVSISIEADFENPVNRIPFRADYGIEVKLSTRGKVAIATEHARILNRISRTTVGFDRKDEHVEWVGFDDQSPPLIDWCPVDRLMLGTYANSPFFELSAALHEVGVYNFSPDVIRELQKPTPGILMDRTGRNLASVIGSIQEEDARIIRRIEAYLHAIVEDVEGFEVVPYGEYETIRFRIRTAPDAKPIKFDAASMSDGTLRALAALVAASQVQLPSGHTVIGIEEPEISLHPAAMRALVDALDEATLRTQILLTTHSTEMLDNPTIRPENVRVVQMIDGQTVIAPVDQASVDIVRRKLNTLGGLERDNLLEPNLDDLDRQKQLGQTREESPT